MPIFTSKRVKLVELFAYFLATMAVGAFGGVLLSLLWHWLEDGELGLGLFLPAVNAILAGVCFIAWMFNIAFQRTRPSTRHRTF